MENSLIEAEKRMEETFKKYEFLKNHRKAHFHENCDECDQCQKIMDKALRMYN